MNPFTLAQRQALRQLQEIWKNVSFCLIGASGLRCHVELPRPTNDLDLVIALSLGAFPGGLDKLEGWSRHPRKEHEWHAPGDVQVDVLPAGEELLARGEIVWPGGQRMSLVGMRLAFATAIDLEISRDVSIPVASLCSLALLKMVSYLDRPQLRDRDLEDVGHVLENYVALYDQKLFADDVPQAIALHQRPAFLLGQDLKAVINGSEKAIVEDFVALARGRPKDTTRSRILRFAPIRWRTADDPEAELDLILSAFQAGLD